MFTGIIEETGSVRRIDVPGTIDLQARVVTEGTNIGDSISVSGVCLTVVVVGRDSLGLEVMPETTRRTTLAAIAPGDEVNLERAVSAGGRLSGHIVNGHVDGVGMVTRVTEESNARLFEVQASRDITSFLVDKGSVAIDGISLTVVSAERDSFVCSVIPHTLNETTLKNARAGIRVNIEVDILAKYVKAFVSNTVGNSNLAEALRRGGFEGPGLGQE